MTIFFGGENMLKAVFGSCPQVKTLDFLLSTYDGHFNKTQIANGAEISRPTLNNFIDKFQKYQILTQVDENKFELNTSSEIVKSFAKANLLLADIEAYNQTKNNSFNKIKYSEEELDDIMDNLFDDEIDLSEEEYQEKIAKEEEILVKKKEYENLKIIKTTKNSENQQIYSTMTNETNNKKQYNRTINLFKQHTNYIILGQI